MNSNIYKRRDPNDKTTYVPREDQLILLNKRREFYRMVAQKEDLERLFNNFARIPKKDRYAVGYDGNIKSIHQYKTDLYTHYDSNNPALVQGGPVMMGSSKILYKYEIDKQNKEAMTPGYIESYTKDTLWAHDEYIE